MRVAIVHDYIKEYGGAERVLEALHELYPDAPVYTSVYLPEFLGPHRDRFKGWDIRTSWVQKLPIKSKLISPLRLVAPLLFRSFDFSQYDCVIVSATGAYSSNFIRTKNSKSEIRNPKQIQNSRNSNYTLYAKPYTLHICYCHTPPRYLYGYATAREWKKNIVFRFLGEIANHFLRMVDFKAAQNVDYFIANSNEVASRIKKFYRRDSVVIYPPAIEVESIKYKVSSMKRGLNTKYLIPNTEYYLAGGRLARAKHVDLIVQAFEELKLPLKVFGKGFAGSDKEILRYKDTKILGKNKKESFNIPISQYPNIQFLGEITDEEKLELMRNAKAYIFASEDEDFGITPVEAMSVGTPVIAYRSGGVLETVIEGKTGLFFEDLTVESLKKTIQQYNNITINPEDCIKQAGKFSKKRFLKEIEEFVKEKM